MSEPITTPPEVSLPLQRLQSERIALARHQGRLMGYQAERRAIDTAIAHAEETVAEQMAVVDGLEAQIGKLISGGASDED